MSAGTGAPVPAATAARSRVSMEQAVAHRLIEETSTIMPDNVNPPRRKSRIFLVMIALAASGLILIAAGFTVAATQEEHDSFCASCHTEPESTFFQRSIAMQASDLASFHTTEAVRCIDCHSGVGFEGRISAELMGAHNAVLWFTGTAEQPAPLTYPISDQNCLKCHASVVESRFGNNSQITVPGGNRGREGSGASNHWHFFLARWQAASTSAGTCTSCHEGHTPGGTDQSGFMISQTVEQVCNDCHRVLRRGD